MQLASDIKVLAGVWLIASIYHEPQSRRVCSPLGARRVMQSEETPHLFMLINQKCGTRFAVFWDVAAIYQRVAWIELWR